MKMKDKIIVVIRVAVALIIWFNLIKCYKYFIEPLYVDKVPEVVNLVITSMILPYTVGLGWVYLMLRDLKSGEIFSSIKPTPGLIAKSFLVQTGLSMPVVIVVNIICILVGASKGGMTAEELFGKNWLFYLILLLVFNPIFEELLFRKLALDKLLVLGEVPAIIISSFLFALPHIISQGAPMFFGTFIIANVWAYVRIKTGRLWPVMVLHGLFNLYGSYLALFMTSTAPTSVLYVFVSAIVLPTVAIILLIVHLSPGRTKLEIGGVN